MFYNNYILKIKKYTKGKSEMQKLTQAAREIKEARAKRRAERKSAEQKTPSESVRNPLAVRTVEELQRLHIQMATYFWNVKVLTPKEKEEWRQIINALKGKGIIIQQIKMREGGK